MTTYQMTYKMPLATLHEPQRHPRTYPDLVVRPLSGSLGAQVTGIDLESVG